MKNRALVRAGLALVVLFWCSLSVSLHAGDVAWYLVSKGISYVQNGPGAVTVAPGQPPFSAYTCVQPAEGMVYSAHLQLPNLTSRPLEQRDSGGFYCQEFFAAKAALDGAFSPGTYVLSIDGALNGSHLPALVLTNDAYPSAPHVYNWAAAQAIQAEAHFALIWDAFAGGTAYDFIQLWIEDSEGNELFRTPDPGQPKALNGTARYAVIPAGTLAPGMSYKCRLLFFRTVSRNSVGFPGASGVSGYFRTTEFPIQTANAAGRLQFSSPTYLVQETNGYAQITVTRSGGSQGTVSVRYATIQAGSATLNEDYMPTNGILEFAPGQITNTVFIPILPDAQTEGPETLALNLFTTEGGATWGQTTYAVLTIVDAAALAGPDICGYIVAKGMQFKQTNNATPALSSSPAYQFLTFVQSAWSGVITNATVQLPNGAKKILDWEETGAALEQSFSAKTTLDAAFPNGTYTLGIGTLDDGWQSGRVTLGRDAYPNTPRILNWSEAQGFNAQQAFTLTWEPLAGGTSADYIRLAIEDEAGNVLFESPAPFAPGKLDGTAAFFTFGPNTFSPGVQYRGRLLFAKALSLNTNPPGATGIAANFKETEFTLSSVNPAGLFSFSQPVFYVDETDMMATITVTRTGGAEGEVEVEYVTWQLSDTPNPASEFADYDLAFGRVVFAAGVTSQTFTVSILNDDLLEGPEVLGLSLGNPIPAGTLGKASTAVLTIIDDEAFTVPSVANSMIAKGLDYLQTNPGAPLLPAGEARWSFLAAVEPSYCGAVSNVRLRRPNGSLVPLASDSSQWSFRARFAAKANLDLAFPAGTYLYTLDSSHEGILNTSLVLPVAEVYPTTPHIANWDAAQDIDASEDFTLRWDTFSHRTINSFIRVEIFGPDRQLLFATPGPTEVGAPGAEDTAIVIPAFTLPAGGSYEGNLVFGNPTTCRTNADGGLVQSGFFKQTTFTLATAPEEPPGGRLQFSAPEYVRSETGSVASVTVTRTRGSAGEVSVDFMTVPRTAAAGADYTPVTTTLFFGHGETSDTVTVPILDDALLEGPELVCLVLTNPVGAILGPQSNAVLRILDNEVAAAGTLQLSASVYSCWETSRYGLVTITRAGGSAGTVAVTYATTPGTATPGVDYTNVSASLVFAPGVTTRSFIVPLRNDTYCESNKTVLVSLCSPTGGASLGLRTNAVLTILNDDLGGTISFSTNAYRIMETGRVATITIVRTRGLAAGVEVSFAASDGTAQDGVDYASTNGTLTFAPGETSKRITIPIQDNAVSGADKTVLLTLRNATGGGTLGSYSNAVLTIVDDEPEVVLGNYHGRGTMYLSGCSYAGDNGVVSFTNDLDIAFQDGRRFTGTATLRQSNGTISITQTLSGTVNYAGQISGSYAFSSNSGEGGFGTFTGTLAGERISISFTGYDTWGDTCRHSGWLGGGR